MSVAERLTNLPSPACGRGAGERASPELPRPELDRWQPLRLGVVELFHYDSEEFWFRDGHLLLRGNNGTGKSKLLSLTLPFLFDAQLKSSRIEPDGDAGKRMSWNLLLGKHERRVGYTWVEFGRRDEDGSERFLTLGCGLSAVAARPQVDSWYFLVEERRIGHDLWLTTPQRSVLARERLHEAIAGHGQVFPTAEAYRRAVDERLFRLGPARYAALMDTLIQLRQPQLSRRPDENTLSEALTEALPPLPGDLLGDVADALNQLEEYRQELDDYEALAKAVGQFNRRYGTYAATRARREARVLRIAQTGFDNASQALNEARSALAAASAEEIGCRDRQQQIDARVRDHRTRLETLRADPRMHDARRLDEAKEIADERRREAEAAARALDAAKDRLRRESELLAEHEARAGRATAALSTAHGAATTAASACLMATDFEREAAPLADAQSLAEQDEAAAQAGQRQLTTLLGRRREHLAQMRRARRELDAAEQRQQQAQEQHDARAEECDAAAARRMTADGEVEARGTALIDAWQRHFDGLEQLRLADADAALGELAAWVSQLLGDNPARAALHAAQQQASERLAGRTATLAQRERELNDEQGELIAERRRLEAGTDSAPPAPYFRDAAARRDRPGAPLWQLLEFREHVGERQRAGLEAALEASGLLDAWLMPDGQLLAGEGETATHDTILVARAPQAASLADWLQPAPDIAVAAGVIHRLLAGIACADTDPAGAEAWVAADGRFRLGPAQGAWSKPAAAYIGYAARAAARQRRLAEIANRSEEIEQALLVLRGEREKLERHRARATAEWNTAPTDDALRAAHLEAATAARAYAAAAQTIALAAARLSDAERQRQAAHERLSADAADLRLPTDAAALDAVEAALHGLGDALHRLFLAAQEVRHALPALAGQGRREAEARQDAEHAEQQLAERSALAEQARIRWQTLFATVGIGVEELQRQLEATRQALAGDEAELRNSGESLRRAGEARARADQKTNDGAITLDERRDTRQQAIAALQGFAATGLMAIAAPAIELPEPGAPWTIDAALTVARRAEQTLAAIPAEDADWSRVQNLTSQDYTELTRGLSALGHQAQAETSDYGLIVAIVYRNRPERPDRLETLLADEIGQRRELLTAGERQVLENHLQAEVASVMQRMLQDADRHVAEINAELDKHPTSTGVRFHLVWEPLPEGGDGAPVGLEAARRRLLNTSADAWSAADRQAVGDMLHGRIAAERARIGGESGGSLLEQLTRALDYRRWHRFRVKRWQDGRWSPLTGPASSGERALGLTVPLFAAVSSHYSHGNYRAAPRLVLLDEAFAGIDRDARAHCMALIREFDLDFVMTSESEWGCFAELPGVSICHLLRRENIDAVHVSRWAWDGRARQPEADPDRRFPLVAE